MVDSISSQSNWTNNRTPIFFFFPSVSFIKFCLSKNQFWAFQVKFYPQYQFVCHFLKFIWLMKVHCKIKKILGKITLLYILTFPTCFGKWLLGQKYMYRAFYSINIPNSNTPPHMDHLLCSLRDVPMNSILEFFTYDPNLPLKDIFFLLLSIALRKLTTNNKNLKHFSIEINA